MKIKYQKPLSTVVNLKLEHLMAEPSKLRVNRPSEGIPPIETSPDTMEGRTSRPRR